MIDRNERDRMISDIAMAIAASPYPYSGAAMVCLPDGTQKSRQEFWDSLDESEQDKYTNYAYAAYATMGGYGLETVIAMSLQDYIDEK